MFESLEVLMPFRTPLCPAGHLPLKGGDCAGRSPPHPSFGAGDWRKHPRRLISPLEGEMGGSPEGGTAGRHHLDGAI